MLDEERLELLIKELASKIGGDHQGHLINKIRISKQEFTIEFSSEFSVVEGSIQVWFSSQFITDEDELK